MRSIVVFKRLGKVDKLSSLVLLIHVFLAEAEIWDELLGFEHQLLIETRFTLLVRRLPLILQTSTLLPAILMLLVILELLVFISLVEVFLLLITLILVLSSLIMLVILLLLPAILHDELDQWRYQMIVAFVDSLLFF